MPAAGGRIPMYAIQSWIQPAIVSATSTVLDWSTTAMHDWLHQYPASAYPVPSTDAYLQSLTLDISAQPHPLFQHAMLTDKMLFQEWLDSIRKYYTNGHLQPLDVILGDNAFALFNMISISTIKYPLI